MWMVLLYVTPLTISVVMALLLLSALLLAWWRESSPVNTRRFLRGLLAAATVVYLAILAMPIFSWHMVGSGQERSVDWNPFRAFEELKMNSEQTERDEPSGFGVTLQNEEGHAYYTAQELTPQQLDDMREGHGDEHVEIKGQLEFDQYDYIVHPTTDGDEVVLDSQGAEVAPDVADTVIEEVRPMITADEAPMESNTLIIEERVVNTLLFVPIGIVAYLGLTSWPLRLLYGPILSITIEATQWAMAAGRSAGTGDVLANSLGSAVGIAMAALAVVTLHRRTRNRPEAQCPR